MVLEGRGTVDESMVTGESMPVTKEAASKLIGGTINQTGGLVMRAEKIGRDTMLARIVQMVAEAQRSRAPIQRLADTVSGWFVPAVMAAAVEALLPKGVLGLLGVPPPEATVPANMMSMLIRGITVRYIVEGDADPQEFIPRMAAWYKAGKFPFDRLIGKFPFDQINEAAHAAESGKVIKPVLIF